MSPSKRSKASKRQRIPADSPAYIPSLKSAAKQIRAVFARFEAKKKVLEVQVAVQKKAAEAQAMKDLEKVAKAFGYDAYNGLAGAIAIRLSGEEHGQLRLPWKPKVSKPPKVRTAAEPAIDVVSPDLRARLLKLQEQLA